MDYLDKEFQRRTWLNKKVPAKKPQADLTELPLFGQALAKHEEQQRRAQGALFPHKEEP